jgi:hypothetical protein
MANHWARLHAGDHDELESTKLLAGDDELHEPRQLLRSPGRLSTCCCCCLLLSLAAGLLLGHTPRLMGASKEEGDNPVRLTSSEIAGVRYSPAGITLRSTECTPFSMDPNATSRANMVQRQLTSDSAAALGLRSSGGAEQHSARSRCSFSICEPRPPTRVFHMEKVCLHNETFYLLSDRDTEPVILMDDWWGDPKSRTSYKRWVREVRTEQQIPGRQHVWLGHDWLITSPRFRFGLGNIFHSILEEVGWLGRAMICGSVAASRDTRYLMMHRRRLLGRNTIGRLWEIGTDGAGTYYIPGDAASTAFCFERVHVESEGGDLGPMRATCEHVGQLHPSGAHTWPGWPAGNATFIGFASIVERARARLGYRPEVVPVANEWAVPRVTVVHRLRNRKLVNVAYVVRALHEAGFHVTVVSLECMPLEAQLALVSNSSTLLGVHGAGLTLGHALPQDALVIELRSAPCTEEARGVPYQMRRRNKIIPAPLDAVGPQVKCPPPWKYNSREMDAVVDIAAVMRTIYEKDPIASKQPRK